MVKMFKKIPETVEKPLPTREKNLKFITDIGGWMVFGKTRKRTTTI